jgi:hypothetical protein
VGLAGSFLNGGASGRWGQGNGFIFGAGIGEVEIGRNSGLNIYYS